MPLHRTEQFIQWLSIGVYHIWARMTRIARSRFPSSAFRLSSFGNPVESALLLPSGAVRAGIECAWLSVFLGSDVSFHWREISDDDEQVRRSLVCLCGMDHNYEVDFGGNPPLGTGYIRMVVAVAEVRTKSRFRVWGSTCTAEVG